MFGSKVRENLIATLPTPILKEPVVSIDSVPLTTYSKIAEDLHYEPSELVAVKILAYLHYHSICTYNYEHVDRWLRHSKPSDKLWIWRPFRKEDSDISLKIGRRWENGHYDGSEIGVYDRIVPLPTLKKVKLIKDSFRSNVRFFVSDYIHANPDPFIMVCPSSWKPGATDIESGRVKSFIIIFDHWDEPGF
jgi:hypothetical protein